ncbi:MAG: hypothetical protein ACRC6K_04095 [Fusobacteriaceae bacterium]
MKNIEKEILKFLIEGKAYSDTAIKKNFGISDEELKIIYENLKAESYLETYEEFEKREKQRIKKEVNTSETKSCNGCSSGACKKTPCSANTDMDNSKILVLTEKALMLK